MSLIELGEQAARRAAAEARAIKARVQANEVPSRPNYTTAHIADKQRTAWFDQKLFAGDKIGDDNGYTASADAMKAAGNLSAGVKPAVAVFQHDDRFFLNELVGGALDAEGSFHFEDKAPKVGFIANDLFAIVDGARQITKLPSA